MKMKRAQKKSKGSPEKKKQSINRKKVKQKSRKKTYYENALKHIQGSNIHAELLEFTQAVTERTQRYTTRNIIKQSKQKLKPILPEVDFGPDDSIITLSDNESEITLNTSKPTNNSDKGTKSNEPPRKKSRKQKSMNSSCFIISEDEDFDNTILLDADGENKAPQTSQQGATTNHGIEDIEVIWSSMKSATKEKKQSKSNKNKESEKKQTEKVSKEPENQPKRSNNNIVDGNLILLSENCIVPRSDLEPAPKRYETTIVANMELERPKAPMPPPGPAVNQFEQYQSQSLATIRYTTQTRYDNTMCWDQVFYNRSTAPVNPVSVNPYYPNNIANNVPSNAGNNFPSNIPNNMANRIPSNIITNNPNNIGSSLSNNIINNVPSNLNNIRNNMINNIFYTNIPNTNIPNSNLPRNCGLREVIIDGNNVGMLYTNGKVFSERGVELIVNYFQKLGHIVKVFIPQYRRSQNMHPLLEQYYREGIVVYTPSRQINGKRITPYDDRYIIEYANLCGGIIVSSDQYRDLYVEKPAWRNTIEKRLLMPTFVGDLVMFPEDPLGRGGPKLDVFLRH